MARIILIVLLILSFIANLFIGSLDIPFSHVADILTGQADYSSAESYIILESRLPSAIEALLAGSSLAVAGLLMQTTFRNPLAGPSIMGINSGASLGVAIVMLFLGGTVTGGGLQLGGELAVIAGALAGSLGVIAILLFLSIFIKNDLMLLIVGILIGYLTSSLIMLLNFGASSQGVQSYVLWGMGSYQGIPMSRIPVMAILTGLGLFLSILLVKPLDALLLGDEYALSLGVDIRRVKRLLLISTGILAATATAFCGPIMFIGLAVPHISRMIVRSDIHRKLLPATILTGAVISLLCNLLCIVPSTGIIPFFKSPIQLPLNVVTPLFGVPVILYVIFKGRRISE